MREKKKRCSKLQVLMSMLIAAGMILSMTSVAAAGTRGASPTYEDDLSFGTEVLKSWANTSNAQTVYYGGQAWRVIGYDGSEAASEKGTITLLAAGNLDQTPFGENNVYKGSALRDKVQSIAKDFSEGEKEAIVGKTLETDMTDLLWPLSVVEAGDVYGDLLKADSIEGGGNWWLRTPGDVNSAGYVNGIEGEVIEAGFPVRSSLGVRPAFALNLEQVVLVSAEKSGKASGEVGPDALTKVDSSISDWKLTVKDSRRSDFTAHIESVENDVYTISYSGAATGENEYISAIIADSRGEIEYYGRVKSCAAEADAAGTVKINGGNKLRDAAYFYVFSEQYNGEGKTDLASNLISCGPIYSWATDNSEVTAHMVAEDGTLQTETVKTTEEKVTPFCERDGTETYTAVFTNPAFSKQVKTIVYESAWGHDWKPVSYEWSDDCSSVVASRVCSREPRTHVQKESGTVTSQVTREPSCVEKGETVYTATFHYDFFPKTTKTVETDALGHDPAEAVRENEKAATCTSAGSYDLITKCKRCNDVINRVHIGIPAKGHSPAAAEESRTAATCTAYGSFDKVIRCEVCNEVINRIHTSTEPPKGHSWGEWTEVAATDTKPGERTRTCKRCSFVDKVIIPPTGHQHEMTDVKEVPATCTENGTIAHYECSGCGNSYKNKEDTSALTFDDLIIPAKGHQAGSVVRENEVAATCTEAGYYDAVVYCKVEGCNTEMRRKLVKVDPLGHSWGKWVVTTPSTTTAEGVETRTCTRCNVQETRAIPKAVDTSAGTVHAVGGSTYKVLSSSAVTLVKAKNAKSLAVPAAVKIGGKNFSVTQINAKAFTGKKIRTVTIGKNVKKIGKKAFKGSKAVKMIVKTKKLTKKSVKGSLKGSKIKTVKVKVGKKSLNKKYVKKYKKIFTKKNAGRKVSVAK